MSGDCDRPAEQRTFQAPKQACFDMVEDRIAMKTGSMPGTIDIRTSGPIKNISLPDKWTRQDAAPQRGLPDFYSYLFQSPGHPDVNISLTNSGVPLDLRSAQAFGDLLKNSPAKLLYSSKWEQDPTYTGDKNRQSQVSDSIKELTNVLNPNSVGDNQFTNNRKPPDPRAPMFHIDKMEVKAVNGQKVLAVEGYYTDENTGKPSIHYSSIYAEHKTNNGSEVQQVSYGAASQLDYAANKSFYQNALNSIRW
jgi:hypothetical protein